MIKKLGGKIVVPALTLSIAFSQIGLYAKGAAAGEIISPSGAYIKDLLEARGCIPIDWLGKDCDCYRLHGERVGMPSDNFEENIEAEKIGTPAAKICGLKSGAFYKIFVTGYKGGIGTTEPGYVVKTAKPEKQ
jgi:hypothetical protein